MPEYVNLCQHCSENLKICICVCACVRACARARVIITHSLLIIYVKCMVSDAFQLVLSIPLLSTTGNGKIYLWCLQAK
jgi:hypothetical protein